ncbi:hypothetical protein BH23BAC3_BH23BAC3_15070 [soil metagenome]
MSETRFKLPPITTNSSGNERVVGYEFEFTGVEMDDVAKIIQSLYGGIVKKLSTYKFEIQNTRLGSFKIELDAQVLSEKKYEKTLRMIGIDISMFKNIESIEGKLKDIASSVVPFEITTPPIRLSQMEALNSLLEEMRIWKVKGTGSSIFYAFGLHINPEIPSRSTESILNHLRAFVLLDPWIRRDAEIDMSRKITPFIKEFKEDYKSLLLSPNYHPSLDKLISDYFVYENSRNRPMDLQPLFMYLNKDLTEPFLEDTLTHARPTYHYRLPNCSIENDEWTLASEWNRWVLVEKLADDERTLRQYGNAYLKMKKESGIGFESKWIKLMRRWTENVF